MLAKRWREHGDRGAAHKLVTSHLRLVTKIARDYRGYGLPIAEAISEGNVGLVQAVERFEPEKGFRLATYAMWWIKATIQEYILRSWSLVKMGTTANQKKLFFNLRKAQSKISILDDGDMRLDQVMPKSKTSPRCGSARNLRLRRSTSLISTVNLGTKAKARACCARRSKRHRGTQGCIMPWGLRSPASNEQTKQLPSCAERPSSSRIARVMPMFMRSRSIRPAAAKRQSLCSRTAWQGIQRIATSCWHS